MKESSQHKVRDADRRVQKIRANELPSLHFTLLMGLFILDQHTAI